ncbi:MAG: hypothetical protein LBJ18_00985 [Rickettsiales bacterium]|nr:hypothetical protein [Rickettsiales bacterium]
MKPQKLLFITSNATRGLYLFGRQLQKLGFEITIAAPAGSQHFWLWGDFIPLRKVFKFLFSTRKFKVATGTKIFALDNAAARFATRAKLKFSEAELNFGLDPVVWNPNAATIAAQQRILKEFGIAPHQKLISVISPLGASLDELISAVISLPRNDFVIALTGSAAPRRAKKILKKIADSGAADRIICTGDIRDMPSFLRASFAIFSLGEHQEQLLKSAVSMGRPTVWAENDYDIKPNIILKDDLIKTLNTALDLPGDKLEAFQKANLSAAKGFSIEKTVKEFLA